MKNAGLKYTLFEIHTKVFGGKRFQILQ